MTDLRLSGLTVDEVESAIVSDIETCLSSGVTFPAPAAGLTAAAERAVSVAGKTVTYRAVASPGGTIYVSTYFET